MCYLLDGRSQHFCGGPSLVHFKRKKGAMDMSHVRGVIDNMSQYHIVVWQREQLRSHVSAINFHKFQLPSLMNCSVAVNPNTKSRGTNYSTLNYLSTGQSVCLWVAWLNFNFGCAVQHLSSINIHIKELMILKCFFRLCQFSFTKLSGNGLSLSSHCLARGLIL